MRFIHFWPNESHNEKHPYRGNNYLEKNTLLKLIHSLLFPNFGAKISKIDELFAFFCVSLQL